MNTDSCKKHGIVYNTDTTNSCPLCKNKIFVTPDELEKKSRREQEERNILSTITIPDSKKSLREFIENMPKVVFSNSRITEVIAIRKECIKILFFIYKLSYSHTGRIMKKDHTTIMHHIKEIRKEIENKI